MFGAYATRPVADIGAQARLQSCAVAKRALVEAVEVERNDLLSTMFGVSQGTVKCAGPPAACLRPLSQDSSNAVHRSAPRRVRCR